MVSAFREIHFRIHSSFRAGNLPVVKSRIDGKPGAVLFIRLCSQRPYLSRRVLVLLRWIVGKLSRSVFGLFVHWLGHLSFIQEKRVQSPYRPPYSLASVCVPVTWAKSACLSTLPMLRLFWLGFL